VNLTIFKLIGRNVFKVFIAAPFSGILTEATVGIPATAKGIEQGSKGLEHKGWAEEVCA